LLDPRDLSAAQREVYDRLKSTFVRWSDRVHFQGKTEDGKLIGPFNPILYSPGIYLPFVDSHDAEEKQTSVNEKRLYLTMPVPYVDIIILRPILQQLMSNAVHLQCKRVEGSYQPEIGSRKL
jgi:hypothetical protein